MATEDAEELWSKARAMPHGFIPDFQTDGEYLDLLCRAAKLGHLEAMKKLGEYAARPCAHEGAGRTGMRRGQTVSGEVICGHLTRGLLLMVYCACRNITL